MSRDEMRELQNQKLRWTVRNGYHNAPVIRDLWDDADVTPNDIEDIHDLAKAPVFRKADTRQRMIDTGEPFGGRLAVPEAELYRNGAHVTTSSGTTGSPTNVAFTQRDLDVLAECQARVWSEMGLRQNDLVFGWTFPNHVAIDAFPRGAEKIGAGATLATHSPAEVARAVHVLEYLEPTVVKFLSNPIVGELQDYYEENNFGPTEVWESVEGVGFGGEPLLDATRQQVEEWGVEVYEFSGGLEPGWFPTECREHDRWLHVPDDHFYVEILDPDTGERLERGRGELVVTALSFEAMAHIRWAHDDIVEIERGGCDCGRVGTRIKFMGRVGDLIRIGETDILPFDVLPIVNTYDGMPNNLFQFYEGSDEELRMNIGYKSDFADDPDGLAAELQDRLESELGVSVKIVETLSEEELIDQGPAHKIPRVTTE